MSFEVDAFMGAPAVPPPARTEPPRAAPEGPSFDDHLNEATAEREPVETRPVEAKPENKAKETPEQPEEPTATPAAAPTPPPQPQAPIVIQLIADAPPTTDAPVEADATTETPEIAPQAPSAPAPVAPVKAGTAQNEAPQHAPVAPVEAKHAKNDAPAKSDAPVTVEAPQSDAPVADAPEAPVQQAQAPTPQPEAPQQPPQPQLIAQAAPTPRVTQSVESETASVETPTETAPETAALDASDDVRTAKAETDPRAETPKNNAPASASAKDSFAALAALASQDAGPQTQAPAHTTPASAIAGTELSSQSAHVTAENVARAAPAAAQVSREIIRRFNGQSTTLELRLDPPELGKVEVRLEVSRDHKVTAVVSAESPAALAELARNARDLQQALQSAGLDLSDKGLSFDLKQQRESRDNTEGGSSRSNSNNDDSTQASTPTPSRPIGLESWRGVRVDLVA